MSDIVQDLRLLANRRQYAWATCGDAADEIDRLRVKLRDATAVLDLITSMMGPSTLADAQSVAKAALDRVAVAGTTAHVHSDECWEPDSGCDMGRNEDYVRVVSPEDTESLKCRCIRADGETRFNINCVIHGKAP